MGCDFLYMARSIFKRGAQAGGCAHYFALTSEEDRVIVSKIMRGFFGRFVGSVVLGSACVLAPLAFWMDTPHHDTATMVGFIISGVCLYVIHMTMCGHTYEFECSVIAMKQDTYVTKLFQGQMGVDDALVSLERLTTLRKKCKETWESELTIFFGMNYLVVTWCFYDYLYKTWSCGALLAYVIMNSFVFVSTLLPIIEMNEWTEKLRADMAHCIDRTRLPWTLAERANFLTVLEAGKVEMEVLGIPMNQTFLVILAGLYAGWFFYLVEIKMFHEYSGFEWDTCGAKPGGHE